MSLRDTPFVKAALAFGFAVTFSAGATAADVTIAVPDWPSANATAHVLGKVIEVDYGLSVAYRKGTVHDLFEGLDNGAIDIFPEVWLPNHLEYVRDLAYRKHSMVLASRGIPAQQGICTTRYGYDAYHIRSVLDLTKPEVVKALDSNADKRGEMWIGAPDWSSTRIEKIRAKSYGYDQTMQLLESDERTAMAALDVAVAVHRPYVFYCYEPHHMFVLHDIVLLDEPAYDPTKWNVLDADEPEWLDKSEAGTAWGVSFIHIGYGTALKEKHPAVAGMLENVELEADTISAMTYALIVERTEPEVFAADWIRDNGDRVATWTR